MIGNWCRIWIWIGVSLLLTACGTLPKPEPESRPEIGQPKISKPTSAPRTKKPKVVLKKGGGFYKDDGPADEIPDNLDDIPDAEPKWEPVHRPATKPYAVLGKQYVPNATLLPYKAVGIASWYGKKFHGQKTSIGEPYDMFAMTAAHPTLAIPSYVRVSNLQNGKSVVVRVTDRGPFHADRIIDLSYTAAWKLGLIGNGSGRVEVEAILPGEYGSSAHARMEGPGPFSDIDAIETLAKRLLAEDSPSLNAGIGGAVADGTGGASVYVQLGAFTNADNAENLKNHLSRELDWLAEPMRISVSSGIHRLQLGPYANRADAARIAEKIRLALGFKPAVVSR